MAVGINEIDRRARLPRPALAHTSTHACAGDGIRDDGPSAPNPTADAAERRPRVDPVTHRTDVVRRLMERGVTVRALEALLPGWEGAITQALEERDTD